MYRPYYPYQSCRSCVRPIRLTPLRRWTSFATFLLSIFGWLATLNALVRA